MRRNTMMPSATTMNAKSVPMLTNSPRTPIGVNPEANATINPVMIVVTCGVRKRGWMRLAHAGSSPSCAIDMKMRGCATICTMMVDDSPAIAPSLTTIGMQATIAFPRRPAGPHSRGINGKRHRRRHAELLIRHEADHHRRDEHVETRADDERREDADRHVTLRVARLLCGRRNRVEADIGEEDHAGAAQDAAPSEAAELTGVGRHERLPVFRRHEHAADADDQQDHGNLDRDDDRVDSRRFFDADDQQNRDGERDQTSAGRLRMAVAAGAVGEHDRRAGRRAEERWKAQAEIGEKTDHIRRPAHRDRCCTQRVFENQVPADDPRDELSKRRVTVGIR